MKLLSLILFISLAVSAIGAHAQSTSEQNATWSLTGTDQTFTFSRFDSSLGTLTAVDFIINSSAAGGSASITNNIGGDVLISALLSRIRVAGTGFTTFTTTNTGLGSAPSTPLTLSDGDTQAFTVTSTSLLGLPATRSISAASFSSYIGSGNTPNFTSRLVNTTSNDAGGDPSLLQTLSFTAPNTSVTLRYTYSSAAIPEPGQVAASLLLLGGIGAYVFLKRRKKTVNSEA